MEKIALVTGASRGIGRGIALQLAAEGWDVCVNYIKEADAAASVVSDIRAMGRRAIAVQADVADNAAVAAMVRETEAQLGPVSLLVNNAGISVANLFQDTTDELWDRCMAVNLTGARNAIMAVLPHMIHEKAGSIVNISSMWGLRGASCEVAYSCTKAALIGLTRSLALELAPSGIRVNCLAPGVVLTDMCKNIDPETMDWLKEDTPLGRHGLPEDMAHAMAYLTEADFLTGQILPLNGGMVI